MGYVLECDACDAQAVNLYPVDFGDEDPDEIWSGLYTREAFTPYGVELRGFVCEFPEPYGDLEEVYVNLNCRNCQSELRLAEAEEAAAA